MKYLGFWFLVICNFTSCIKSKSVEFHKGIVHYGQIESKSLGDTIGPDFNSYLVFDNNHSYYVFAKDSLEKATHFKKRYYSKDSLSIRSYAFPMTSRYGKQVYYNRKSDSLYWRKWEKYYVSEKTPQIDWELISKTKTIQKHTVYKAQGQFRGRIYTAWYTKDIALPYGPWKLQGLPGLILEAYDEKKEMYFYLKNLEYPTKNNTSITQVKRPEGHPKDWNTLEDFEKRVNFFYEKFLQNSVSANENTIPSDIFIESF
ncbi:GLPGLI family protein [Psychroserpens sp. SPM9]|uniref:GLPGLI family protein n=1 Tax=Psychroserpens sp. SPM9 TaxID=2975598 RepID=UPI0021A8DF69|nr:GLPGLI family protein [Psychroserpens sp. SPM9]MDG5490111.1 GLPGLI family protein [Psychroserpens sp. SPM9]